MLAAIVNHPHWFWLTLGGLLLIAEMLGSNGYLLWSGIAALTVGLIRWLLPFTGDAGRTVRPADADRRVSLVSLAGIPTAAAA